MPDGYRLVSADGMRSIRFGGHEMDSPSNLFHYHEEVWSVDEAGNWFVDNVIRRVI